MCSPAQPPRSAGTSAVNSAVNSAGNTQPTQAAAPPGAREHHATPVATQLPSPTVTEAGALSRGVKRRAGENACDARAAQLLASRDRGAARRRSVLADFWRGRVDGDVPGLLGGGGTALTLSVVQAVLDVDECLALCDQATGAH